MKVWPILNFKIYRPRNTSNFQRIDFKANKHHFFNIPLTPHHPFICSETFEQYCMFFMHQFRTYLHQSITLHDPDSNVARGGARPPVPKLRIYRSAHALLHSLRRNSAFARATLDRVGPSVVAVEYSVVTRSIMNMLFGCALDLCPFCWI